MQRVAAVDVLNLLAAEGPHAAFVREALDASEVWQAYRDRKHDLYLPAAKPQVCSAAAFAATCIDDVHRASPMMPDSAALATHGLLPDPRIGAAGHDYCKPDRMRSSLSRVSHPP